MSAHPDLSGWCDRQAAAFRDWEHREIVVHADRDAGIIGWTARVLGNPDAPQSREVLEALAERHGLKLTEPQP